jgi:hypothetical protein
MPGDDARQRHGVEIADRRADSGGSVDDIAILQAGVIRGQRILDVESHPVSPGRPAVDKKHNAECDCIHNSEANCEPDTPVPLLRVCARDKAAVEEQDRHLSTSAADQKGELGKPHAEHSV